MSGIGSSVILSSGSGGSIVYGSKKSRLRENIIVSKLKNGKVKGRQDSTDVTSPAI